jgi:hypothetical protein
MDTQWWLNDIITSIYISLALLYKQKHLEEKRASKSAFRNYPLRTNFSHLSNDIADFLPIRINHWQNGFKITAAHSLHRTLLTIRLALLGSSSNRSLAQTTRMTFRSVGSESRLSRGRRGWRRRLPRRNFNLITCYRFHRHHSVQSATLQLSRHNTKNRRTERTKIFGSY